MHALHENVEDIVEDKVKEAEKNKIAKDFIGWHEEAWSGWPLINTTLSWSMEEMCPYVKFLHNKGSR